MKKLFIIFFVFGVEKSVFAQSTIHSSCSMLPYGPMDISGFGDSRAWEIEVAPVKISDNYNPSTQKWEEIKIQNAVVNAFMGEKKAANIGNTIIHPRAIPVMTTRAIPGTNTVGWIKKFASCNHNYSVPSKLFISLGGNDISAILKDRQSVYEQYSAIKHMRDMSDLRDLLDLYFTRKISSLKKMNFNNILNEGKRVMNAWINWQKQLLLNPGKAVSMIVNSTLDLIKNRLKLTNADYTGALNFDRYWQWRTNILLDQVTLNMYHITDDILRQSDSHKILINTIAPPAPINIGAPEFTRNYPDTIRLFLTLNGKYMTNLIPILKLKYGPERIVLVDTWNSFSGNLLGQGGSYYADGVHFTNDGLIQWGRMMANAMVTNGWYPPGPGYVPIPDPKIYNDEEVNTHHIGTMVKGLEDSVPLDSVMNKDLTVNDSGFKKDFSEFGMSYYTRHSSPVPLKVQGDILTKYKSVGESDGMLGAPVSDELCFGPASACGIRVSFFEKGTIFWDALNTDPRVSVNVQFPNDAAQSADPDFDSCVSSPCDSRWFEFNDYQLQAKSGTAPYIWNIVSGSLPDGTVLFENGAIYKPPTNNGGGSWTARVRLTDAKGRFKEKDIVLRSGL